MSATMCQGCWCPGSKGENMHDKKCPLNFFTFNRVKPVLTVQEKLSLELAAMPPRVSKTLPSFLF